MVKFFTGEDGSQLIVVFKDSGDIESITTSKYCYFLDPKGSWKKFQVNQKGENDG